MKNRILDKLSLGLALAFTPLVGGCLQQTGIAPEHTTSVNRSTGELQYFDAPQSAQEFVSAEEGSDTGISDAPVKPIQTDKPIPANIRPTQALSEMIRLADSGVDETVLLAYVTNSSGAFSLGSEEIIYLNDIGVPARVVTAMLQHDHMLLDNAAQALRAPVLAATEPNTSVMPPVPFEAPQGPDFSSDYSAGVTSAEPSDPNFYDALAPYGSWVNVEGYGQCWQPSVVAINPEWRPYCDRGHWVNSDCGWYWSSDYSWGWAPFHYGRWFRHNRLGWCWEPDRVWGPSWVSWRYSNDYCGWAPLPPAACFRPGLGFVYHGRSVGFSFNFGISASCFTFVSASDFCDQRLSHHVLPREHVTKIFNSTVVVSKIVGDHNRIVNHGIPVERIAAATHTHIRQVAVRQGNDPVTAGGRSDRIEAGARGISVSRPHTDSTPRSPSALVGSSGSETRSTISSANSSPRSRVPENPLLNGRSASGRERGAGSREQIFTAETPRAQKGARSGLNTDYSANHFSRSARQNSDPAATASIRPAQQQPYRSWTSQSQRSVEGRPRYEQPGSYDRHEPPQVRSEAQNRWTAPSSFASPAPSQQHYAAPPYQARVEMPHHTMPSYSPPAHVAHEMPAAQPHVESHSAPQAAVAAPSHDHSSSDKRGGR